MSHGTPSCMRYERYDLPAVPLAACATASTAPESTTAAATTSARLLRTCFIHG